MFRKRRPGEWIETDSSFGGIGIYKAKTIGDAYYTEVGETGCEHVPFHSYLKKKGAKIYINNSLINGGWTVNARHSFYNWALILIVGKHYIKVKEYILLLRKVYFTLKSLTFMRR